MDARQFSNEMKYGRFYRDLDDVVDRYADEDLLAIDDVDLSCAQEDMAALLERLVKLRQARNKRTLLTATKPEGPINSSPLAALLRALPAVSLTG